MTHTVHKSKNNKSLQVAGEGEKRVMIFATKLKHETTGKAVSNIRAIYYPFFSVSWGNWQKIQIESMRSDYIPKYIFKDVFFSSLKHTKYKNNSAMFQR